MYYIVALMVTIIDILLVFPMMLTGALGLIHIHLSEWKENLEGKYDAEADEQNEGD